MDKTDPATKAAPATPAATPLQPSEVLRRARANVEHIAKGGEIHVVGEVSGKKALPNGHWTFDLKDSKAKLPCIVFFNDTKRVKFEMTQGLVIVATGKPTVTEWSVVQLRVVRIEPHGEGALELARRQLVDKLTGEGLFAAARKRALPFLPRTVGVVTSSTGAAVRDVIKVLFDRMPRLRVVIRPTKVQGEGAGADVAEAIQKLDAARLCDVILVVRGGGSLEDLWAYNSEPVARAIARCSVPVVTGVGHETDVTIADMVADKRAATPSHAAEIAVRRLDEVERLIDGHARRLVAALKHGIGDARAALDKRKRRLLDPRHLVAKQRDRVVALERRMERALRKLRDDNRARLVQLEQRLTSSSPARQVVSRRKKLTELEARLVAVTPAKRIGQRRERVATLAARLQPALDSKRARAARSLEVVVARLHSISPLAVLARGYAIARRGDDGAVVRSPADAPPGTQLTVRVEKGSFRATVDE